jgi:SAM-dependent methyltransferase
LRDDVIQKEAAFGDARYARFAGDLAINPRMFRKYAEPRNVWDPRDFGALRLGDVAGKELLDLGCGMGEEAAYFAKLGARVTAIDVSPVGVELTRRRAELNGVAERVRAMLMSADPTGFADESFDVVHGFGILHHIGLERSLPEVRRLLRPGGKGLFTEHVGDSLLVERLKGRLRGLKAGYTEHERPLRWAELEEGRSQFRVFECSPYYLLSRVRRLLPPALRDLARRIDHAVLKMLPFLRHYAGLVVIYLEK